MPTTIAERLRADVLSRMKTPTLLDVKSTSVRRSHLTEVDRQAAPAIYVIEGADEPVQDGKSSRCPRRRLSLTVRLILRDDAGTSKADPYLIEILRRLDDETRTYGEGVTAELGRIAPDQDVADKDVVDIGIDLTLTYSTTGTFKLT